MEIFIGLISGIVSSMGMGGGTILILSLSMVMGIEQRIAQATNLIFFIPTSIIAIITNLKQKLIDLKTALPIAFSGIVGAIAGAKIANQLPVSQLKRYFGIFLGVIAGWEIYSLYKQYKETKKRNNNNRMKHK